MGVFVKNLMNFSAVHNKNYDIISDISGFTEVKMLIMIFHVAMLCSLIDSYQHSGEVYCLHLEHHTEDENDKFLQNINN